MTIEIPTVEEELNLKTLNTLEWLMRKREQREIDGAEFAVALDTLFMAVSGLIDGDNLNLVTEASRKNDGITHTDKRVYRKEGIVVVVGRQTGSEKILITKNVGRRDEKRDIKEFETSEEACRAQQAICSLLSDKGFIAI